MAETRNCHTNRFRIDPAHKLSDVLFLTTQSAMGFDATCLKDGLKQVFVEPDVEKVRLLQPDKVLAEFLKRKKFAFSRAFAGL